MLRLPFRTRGPTGLRPRRLVALTLIASLLAGAVALAAAGVWLWGSPDLWGAIGLQPRGPGPGGIDPNAPIDPSRQYHLVVWDYRLPFTSAGGAGFARASEWAIRRFEARHPNVTVDLHLLDPAEGPARLAEALAAGYPPDVFCSLYGPPATGSPLQVPVGLYLDYDTWSRYHPVAWQAVKVDGTVWAWPRWLMLWPWLGNRKLLEQAGVDVGQVARVGWTREEFARAAAALASPEDRWDRTPALAAPSPAVVLRDLLFPGHLAAQEPVQPDSFWLGAEVGSVALWLSELRDAGALRKGGEGDNRGVVDSFVHGRSAVLVNPSPWATMFILEPVARPKPWEFSLPSRERPPMVLLPPPHSVGEPSFVWVSVSPVLVFRQARYRGDGNTRLAVELAREISDGARPHLRDQFLCVPPTWSEIASWKLRCARFGEDGAFAVRAFDQLAALPEDRLALSLLTLTYGPWAPRGSAPARPGGPAPGETGAGKVPAGRPRAGAVFTGGSYLGPFLQETVAPAVLEFWNGDASPGDLVNDFAAGVLEGQ